MDRCNAEMAIPDRVAVCVTIAVVAARYLGQHGAERCGESVTAGLGNSPCPSRGSADDGAYSHGRQSKPWDLTSVTHVDESAAHHPW